MPKEKFETSTAREFIIADQFYKKYLKDQSTKNLNLLCATLCRPATSKAESIILEDNRIKLISRNHAEKTAWKFRFVPRWKKICLIAYFGACKKTIDDVYGPYLFHKSEDSGTKKSGSIDFGWNGFFMSIAESNIFGKFDQVVDTRLHTVLFYALKKVTEAEESNTKN